MIIYATCKNCGKKIMKFMDSRWVHQSGNLFSCYEFSPVAEPEEA